jgi:hypothetical protein
MKNSAESKGHVDTTPSGAGGDAPSTLVLCAGCSLELDPSEIPARDGSGVAVDPEQLALRAVLNARDLLRALPHDRRLRVLELAGPLEAWPTSLALERLADAVERQTVIWEKWDGMLAELSPVLERLRKADPHVHPFSS